MPALQFGQQMEMWQDDQIYAFCRRHEGQECITVLNNSYDHQTRNIPLREGSPLHNGDVMVDVLTGDKFTVNNNCLNIGTADKQGRVLVPEKDYGRVRYRADFKWAFRGPCQRASALLDRDGTQTRYQAAPYVGTG